MFRIKAVMVQNSLNSYGLNSAVSCGRAEVARSLCVEAVPRRIMGIHGDYMGIMSFGEVFLRNSHISYSLNS